MHFADCGVYFTGVRLKEVFLVHVHFQVLCVPCAECCRKSLRCCHTSPSTCDKAMLRVRTSTCAPSTVPSLNEGKDWEMVTWSCFLETAFGTQKELGLALGPGERSSHGKTQLWAGNANENCAFLT